MSSTRARRTLTTRTNEVDRLASKLHSNLKISEPAGGRTSSKSSTKSSLSTKPVQSPEEKKALAMRSINKVLQSLSSESAASSSAKAASMTGRIALNNLRTLCPGSVDTERAALSMAGKLLSLGTYDSVIDIMTDIIHHLPTYYSYQEAQPKLSTPLSILQLPLPVSDVDPVVQNCILTYLSHGLSAVSKIVAGNLDFLESFLDALKGPNSLHFWLSHLSQLPRKSLDALCKRAYVTLTTAFSDPSIPPLYALRIRVEALRYLSLCVDLDVTSFWEQCVKFASTYARDTNAPENEKEKTRTLLSCFQVIEEDAEGLRSGKGWITFCEYWMALAKRAGDMQTLNYIASYIRNAASSSKDLSQLVTRCCVSLTQLSASLESEEIDQDNASTLTKECVSNIRSLQKSFVNGSPLDSKLRRAVEKCRRGCIQSLSRKNVSSTLFSACLRLLDVIAIFFEQVIELTMGSETERSDAFVAILDTLFQLSTAIFSPTNADRCDQAYDYLARGNRIVEKAPCTTSEEKRSASNYLRCLSGAFANIAGSLYKADRHGMAIRFLTQACPLSDRAASIFEESCDGDSPSVSEKDKIAWDAHRGQIYRRWELLGVCYMKSSDRKSAFNSFVKGIITFPYEDGQILQADIDLGTGDLELPSSLASAVDRLTHIGTTELLLEPRKISLLEPLLSRKASELIIGAILARQVRAVSHRTRTTSRAVVDTLLKDLTRVYDAKRFPIRRARTLVYKLEHMYYSGEASTSGLEVRTIVQEVQNLLSEKASIREDSGFSRLRPFYRIQALLWNVLHSHRLGEDLHSIIGHSRIALDSIAIFVQEFVGAANQVEAKEKTSSSGRSRNVVVEPATRPRTRSKSTKEPPAPRKTRSLKTRAPVTAENEVKSSSPNSGSHSEKRDLQPRECSILTGLLVMLSEMYDLLGLGRYRMQTLVLIRQLTEKFGNKNSEVFLQASAGLAYELAKLGKTASAKAILTPLSEGFSKDSIPSMGLVTLLLQYAEVLALCGEIPKSVEIYEQAAQLVLDVPEEEKSTTTALRIRERAILLERTARAVNVFASIMDAKDNTSMSLKYLLQALRLLNRATETLSRLNPKKPENNDIADPFAMPEVREALPETGDSSNLKSGSSKTQQQQRQSSSSFSQSSGGTQLDGLEWRIACSLLNTQIRLSKTYAKRGSAREADYFSQQAEGLARVLHSSAWTARALLLRSDIQNLLGLENEAREALVEAMELMKGRTESTVVKAQLISGERMIIKKEEDDARGEFEKAMEVLENLKKELNPIDKWAVEASKATLSDDGFAPVLRARILRQQVWLLRDELGEKYETTLEELLALPQLPHIEVHVNSMLGRLAIYDLHERFRSDMALNSLSESTIALPKGMSCEKAVFKPPQDILEALQQADEHFASDLSRFADRDSVTNVRCAAVTSALISTYKASLNVATEQAPAFAAHLLDMAASITLRRELIEAIAFKFPETSDRDDLQWPSETSKPRPFKDKSEPKGTGKGLFDDLSDDEDDDSKNADINLQKYWQHVLKKHQSLSFITKEEGEEEYTSEINKLPHNWMVVTINLTEDKNALLVSRQRPNKDPLVFCIPFKGRDDDDDEHFDYYDAINELRSILSSSDAENRRASEIIKSDDRDAKAAWWAERKQLDLRMKGLVENIEFCWLGAFKTVLSQPTDLPSEHLTALRTRLEKVFRRILGSRDKKSQKAKLRLEDSLLELFASLPATCRDEELADLVYFVLDLYHFNGIPIALAEVDIDIVVVDLRSVLDEHHARTRSGGLGIEKDAHTFLVLDKNLQEIPWESIPVLRGHSVSRVPSLAFITDRLDLARCQKGMDLNSEEQSSERDVDRVIVDPSKAFFLLNPSADLKGTEGRFKDWVKDLQKVGWEGIVGRAPSEQQFLNALSRKDLVVYFGHNGGEEYARSHKIRHLQRCAATMLWGCSSGALKDMGEFDRVGTPNNYMLAGCPSLVANLWDVTDRDIDKFAQAVFSKLRLEAGEVGKWKKGKRGPKDGKMSIVSAVAQSRDACKLKYLTGAAVVHYGIPYYL